MHLFAGSNGAEVVCRWIVDGFEDGTVVNGLGFDTETGVYLGMTEIEHGNCFCDVLVRGLHD